MGYNIFRPDFLLILCVFFFALFSWELGWMVPLHPSFGQHFVNGVCFVCFVRFYLVLLRLGRVDSFVKAARNAKAQWAMQRRTRQLERTRSERDRGRLCESN